MKERKQYLKPLFDISYIGNEDILSVSLGNDGYLGNGDYGGEYIWD